MQCSNVQQMIKPYITGELDGENLEAFIEHLEECNECYEELEINYTIALALQQLDDSSDISYNINKMLMQDLENSAVYIQKYKVYHTYRRAIYFTAMSVVLLTFIVQLFLWFSYW